MIDHLNFLLRHMMLSEIDQLSDELQIGFQPPDETWRTHVSTLTADGQPANALNIYLIELRENVSLRSNATSRRTEEGIVIETPAPRRLDCHYLITAWSPAMVSPAVEPTVDEHALLYQAVEVLLRNDPLIPSEVYAPDSVPSGTPDAFATAELPVKFLSADGFPKHAEFWGTMGADYRWKPSIEVVVTLPVVQAEQSAGTMVTSRIIEYRIGGSTSSEVRVQIGGHVLNAIAPLPDGNPAPIAVAWVGLEDTNGKLLQTTETNTEGEFSFVGLQRNTYTWRARATGLGDVTGSFSVPAPSGTYDLLFE
jgi:hypothetical protein